jgi:hypothetical protein
LGISPISRSAAWPQTRHMTMRKIKAAIQWIGVITMLAAPVAAVATKDRLWAGVFVAGVVVMVAFGKGEPAPSGPPNDWYKY